MGNDLKRLRDRTSVRQRFGGARLTPRPPTATFMSGYEREFRETRTDVERRRQYDDSDPIAW